MLGRPSGVYTLRRGRPRPSNTHLRTRATPPTPLPVEHVSRTEHPPFEYSPHREFTVPVLGAGYVVQPSETCAALAGVGNCDERAARLELRAGDDARGEHPSAHSPHPGDQLRGRAPPSSILAFMTRTRYACSHRLWDGTINHYLSDNSDSEWTDSDSDSEDTDSDLGEAGEDNIATELRGEALLRNLQEEALRELPHILETDVPASAYKTIMEKKTKSDWTKAEQNRGLGYNGLSDRTKCRREKDARDQEIKDAATRKGQSASFMRSYFAPRSPSPPPPPLSPPPPPSTDDPCDESNKIGDMFGYLSDLEDTPSDIELEEISDDDQSDEEDWDDVDIDNTPSIPSPSTSASLDSSGESRPGSPTSTAEQASPTSTEAPSGSRKRRQAVFRVRAPPPRKRRKLVISARDARREQQEKRLKELKKALKDIRRLIRSKKDVFHAGSASLQAYRARAIESHLTMVLKNGRKHMEASEMAAEAHGFARNWGGRLVRHWVRTWIDKRELPVSERGCHAKTFSLLSDPNVRENVRSFLRSNKWSSDPQMLSTFMKNEMLPDLAKRYAVDEIAPQMARGLKQYLEVELFPRIQFKVARGISVRTCNRIMTMEGFTFTEHMTADAVRQYTI
ncbi:hypothetical protein EV122DRAFT_255977 [Schizophyllum commune]